MKTHSLYSVITALLWMVAPLSGIVAGVRMSPLFADGMVLQRGRVVEIGGWADPGEKISFSMAGTNSTVYADSLGRWTVRLQPMKAGGPYVMKVNDVTLRDVLVGDVFLCSGQSNMELTVARVMDKFADEVNGYENTRVRYLKVPYAWRLDHPADSIRRESWKAMTERNVPGFSALCYFFGRLLQERTGVPVGIVNASWGGTPVEAWTSEDALKDFPEYINLKSMYENKQLTDEITRMERLRSVQWGRQLYMTDPGIHAPVPWYAADMDDSSWQRVDMFSPSWAMRQGRPAAGSHWLRKDFTLTAQMAQGEAVLRLGCMVDADSVYVNGRLVGSTGYQYPPRIYKVPAGLLREGRNQVTIRLVSYGGKPSFVREKPYKIICRGGEVSLEGEWKHCAGAQMPSAPQSTSFQNMPTGLYNGMIYPLRDYTFKGVAWYQGESNVGRWNEYAALLCAMMKDWRRTFGDNLPFYIIELADFLAPEDPGRKAWAEMRKQQAMAAQQDGNATLIKNSDTGEWNDIHPLDKKTPAERLVRAVLSSLNE